MAFFLLLNTALYIRTAGFDFILDDRPLILENAEQYRSLSSFARSLGRPYFDDPAFPLQNYWRPVSSFTFFLDFQLYGRKPAGYHLTNILLNAVNGMLVFFLLFIWSGRWLTAGLAALLFSLHPLHAENVAWISGRPDLLVMLFVLLMLLALLRYHRTRKAVFYWLALPLFILALLSKENGLFILFGVPALVILIPPRGKTALMTLPFLAAGGLYLLLHMQVTGWPSNGPVIIPSIPLVIKTLGAYGRMIFLPFLKGPFFSMGDFMEQGTVYLAAGVLMVLAVVAVIIRRRQWPLAAAGSGSLVFLLGLLNPHIIHYPNIAVRYVYIPGLFGALLAGEWAERKYRQEDRPLFRLLPVMLIGILAVTWGVMTVYYQGFFSREEVRIERLHRLYPREDFLLIHMAVLAYNRGNPAEARYYLDRGIRENRRNPWIDFSFKARILKARILADGGGYGNAVRVLRQALEQKTGDRRDRYGGWIMLADIHGKTGDFLRAFQALEQAYHLIEEPLPLIKKIQLQIQQGDTSGALETLRRGQKNFPEDDRFHRLKALIPNRNGNR